MSFWWLVPVLKVILPSAILAVVFDADTVDQSWKKLYRMGVLVRCTSLVTADGGCNRGW